MVSVTGSCVNLSVVESVCLCKCLWLCAAHLTVYCAHRTVMLCRTRGHGHGICAFARLIFRRDESFEKKEWVQLASLHASTRIEPQVCARLLLSPLPRALIAPHRTCILKP